MLSLQDSPRMTTNSDITSFTDKIFVSVVIPCYNEETILKPHLNTIIDYLEERNHKYRWEIIIINDGSSDKTGDIAGEFARSRENIKIIHHPANLNLGRALQTGFRNSSGDIIVVLDVDLSYSVDHIERMIDKLVETFADMVVASPYMKGGKVTAVPFLRRVMSFWVNKFMRIASQDKYHTYTGMVRAYRSGFIQSMNLKTKDYEVNPEIMYKAMILRARIVEIPAHLDWTEQNKYAGSRTSSMRIIRGFFSGIMSGFIFRPYIFFLGLGVVLMALSIYEMIWLLHNTLSTIPKIRSTAPDPKDLFSYSLSLQFEKNPQTFLIGGIAFIVAIQFLSLGFLSLQSKRYFEELFHMGTSLKKGKIGKL